MAKSLRTDVTKLQDAKLQNELKFLSRLSSELSAEQASKVAAILKPRDGGTSAGDPGGGSASAVSLLAAAEARQQSQHVFVLKFFGDVTASQVATLRQEVTAVLRSAGVKLTVCVEQVAASGGYMMACTADEIVASPFSVLGSIGVITEQPNVYERLKKEGIQFSTVTAGKFKRTLTPTKKIEEQDKKKTKEDIEGVLSLFKDFVAENRPQVNIDEIATGETWLGPEAMKRNMVDELSTVDDVLLSHA